MRSRTAFLFVFIVSLASPLWDNVTLSGRGICPAGWNHVPTLPRSAAAPGYCSWPPEDESRPLPMEYWDHGVSRVPTWVFQPVSVAPATTKRAPVRPIPSEAMTMRLYSHQHRFYCG